MEAMTKKATQTTPRVISDKTTEAQRLISNANAKKVIEGINKSKAMEKKPKDKPAEKAPKPPKYPSFTSRLDEIIQGGGTWEQLIERGNAAKKELEALHPEIPVEFNGKAKLMSLIKYRVEKQERKDYLGKKKVTEKGVL